MTIRPLSFCLLILTSPCLAETRSRVPAFPGAEGFGAQASGGRGGRVLAVTNLNDSGPGSLRAAVEASGPRIVVFRVAGTIPLKSSLSIDDDDITIAGQTAPGGGICLKDYSLDLGGANNVIIRYLRVRPGPEAGKGLDALGGRGGKDIIIDHCSMSWSVDECVSIYGGTDNLTVQWCVISESLYESVHRKGHHGFGGIWGGQRASWHHNLLAHHSSRNPRFPGGKIRQLVDMRNNVVYNWGYNSTYGGDGTVWVNLVNNVYKPGPGTLPGVRTRIANPSAGSEPGNWWIDGNVVPGSEDVSRDNWLGIHTRGSLRPGDVRAKKPLEVAPVKTHSAGEAFDLVLRHAGASYPKRDSVDTRIAHETRSGTARYGGKYGPGSGIIDTPDTVGGWPKLAPGKAPADRDSDGMPDDWESRHGFRPAEASDGSGDADRDGYTNVEEYLNGTDPRKFIDYTIPASNVNTLGK